MDKSMSLQSILDAFKGPVNEEQTWAICFQVIKHVQDKYGVQNSNDTQSEDVESCPSSPGSRNRDVQDQSNQYPKLSEPSQIVLHSDGSISLDSITIRVNEKEFISSIGIVLYDALDYGCDEDEERKLEPSLESFIEKLTCSGQGDGNSDGGGDDEGIERDAGDELTLNSVLGMTINHHLETTATTNGNSSGNKSDLDVSKMAAEKHYRAVTRAIVSEAKDLKTFLDQITKGSKQLRNISSDPLINAALDELCVNDWARLWMQLVKDLRNGVRLKKVDSKYQSDKVCEYELTPYEMLLDDIRSQRYQLKHVELNEKISNQVKKDAHSLILEFIRSRPPLKSVTDRVLPPTPTKNDCVHERLMQSIKKEHKLRPTSSLIVRSNRKYTSLGNIRESLKETSQGLSNLDINDYQDIGILGSNNRRNSSTYTRQCLINDEQLTSPGLKGRKLIKADIDLDLVCYSDDEDFDSCVVTRRKSVIPTTRQSSQVIEKQEQPDRRRSFRNLFGFGQSLRWNFKSNS